MKVVARVSTCLGIGHLMRIKWLLLELQTHSKACITLVLDHQTADLTPFIQELVCDVHCVATATQQDIDCVTALIKTTDADLAILDHYDLDINYEREIRRLGIPFAVFDDLGRAHDCDFLFDAKWEGQLTAKRYHNKLSATCNAYLGPDYALLAPAFSQIVAEHRHTKAAQTRILCSLGGGGDLRIFSLLINAVPKELHQDVQFTLVIGPKAENKHAIAELASQFNNIVILKSPLTLVEQYRNTDLFIGALGTSLYELAALKVPAVTFSIAENQQNDISHLQQLGHYFHLDEFTHSDVRFLGSQLANVISALARIKQLREHATVTVDGLGVKRVAAILHAQSYPVTTNRPSSTVTHSMTQLTSQYAVRDITDADVNNYLLARNLPSNAEKMTINSEIPRLAHYLWWFTNDRKSYVVEHLGSPVVYVWHQHKWVDSQVYLYGGWFKASSDVPFNLAILVLQWQLEFCKKAQPNGIWLAVIHKENKFVNLLNKYMGFVATPAGSKEYKVTQQLFPLADEQFNFVMWDPNAQ